MARFIAGPDGQIRDTQPATNTSQGIQPEPGLYSCLRCGRPLEIRFAWNPFASTQIFTMWMRVVLLPCFLLWVAWNEKSIWLCLASAVVLPLLMLTLFRQRCPHCHEESTGQEASDRQVADYKHSLEAIHHIYNWFFH